MSRPDEGDGWSAPDEDTGAPGAGQQTARREVVVGLVLFFAVVVVGGGQWWTTAQAAAAYQAGVRAVATHAWAGAAAAFGSAGSYSDAPVRRAGAARKAADQDRDYAQATDAIRREDWPAALAALQALAGVTPGYRDSATLHQTAEAGLLAAALGGAVALRPDATPPGLYRYGAAGWQWLAGSDVKSTLLGGCAGGRLLFDGADPVSRAVPPEIGTIAARELFMAGPDGAASTLVPLALGDYEQFQCTAHGVLGQGQGPPRYVPFGTGRPLTPAGPDPAWHLQAVAAQSEQGLFAVTSIGAGRPWHTQFCLAPLAGGPCRALADLPGSSTAATLSADGRYVLLLMLAPGSTALQSTARALLLDTAGPLVPRVLAEVDDPNRTGAGLTGTLMPSGPQTGDVVLTWPVPGALRVRLVDAAGRTTTQDVAGSAGIQPAWTEPIPTGGFVLGLQPKPFPGPPETVLLYVDGANRPTIAHLPAPALNAIWVWAGWARRGRLVLVGEDTSFTTDDLTVWSVDQAQMVAGTASATVLFHAVRGTWQEGGQFEHWWPGPGLLAYFASDGALHARSYDGRADIPLDMTVAGFALAAAGP